MNRKPHVDRSSVAKTPIVQKDMKSRKISETCWRRGIAPNISIDGTMKRNNEPMQRVGEKALPPQKPKKTDESDSWRERWGRKSLEIEN